MKSWLRIMLVGLCVGAVVGLLFPSLSAATVDVGRVSTASWMGDLAGHLRFRKLSDIAIPGSHDSTTYSLPAGAPWTPYGTTQYDDLTQQLNAGVREFDVRVGWGYDISNGWGYYAHHGILYSTWLKLPSILTSIDQWALVPGHEQEIILLNLSIAQNPQIGNGVNGVVTTAPFPSQDCQNFAGTLGGSLVTPSELQAHFGTTDPGQVTLGQLWSLPDPSHAARVIMNNNQCMDAADPSAGQWSTYSSGYYADQCTAGGTPSPGDQSSGITKMVLGAVHRRATEGNTSEPIPWGPAKAGGLYELDIQGTPEADCLVPPLNMIPDERTVFAALYHQWLTDPATQHNLNLVVSDFVGATYIVKDLIAMDATYSVDAAAFTRLGPERVVVEQDQPLHSFNALLTYQGTPVSHAAVTFQVSPDQGRNGPNVNGSGTATVQSDVNGVAKLGGLTAGHTPGTWQLAASMAGVSSKATWTLVVVPSSRYTLKPDAHNPTTVAVDSTTSGGFAVEAVNHDGDPVPHAGSVTFYAGAAGGTFADGAKTDTVPTGGDGIARSLRFRAGTRAGGLSIAVTSPGAPYQSLPLTVTPGDAAGFVATQGDGQSTPINTKFLVALKGHWVDRYANVVIDPPPADRVLTLSPGDGTWSNGNHSSVKITPDANGTITAPNLTVGKAVLDGPDTAHSLIIKVGAATGWTLQVTPGPAAKVTPTSGGRQLTAAGKPFAQALAVKVTDAGDNPVPGAPVTFKLTNAAAASFAPVNLSLAAAATGDQAPEQQADPPRNAVTVLTNDQGIATSPVLTAGPKAGPIQVIASAGAPSAEQAVFHLEVVSDHHAS